MAINVKIAPFMYLDRNPVNGAGDSRMAANVILTDMHRMTTVAEPRLPLLTDFGNASSAAQGSRVPKPVSSARGAPKIRIPLSSRRASCAPA